LAGHCPEDIGVPDTVQCDVHGETPQTFVCVHLKGESSGLGFNREDPTEDNPFPDAWCGDCEIIRAAHGGWDDIPDGLCKIVLLCSECYERARIRNTRPSITFDDLSALRWKCSNCDEWHTGPCLDFGFSEPYYWNKNLERASRWSNLIPRKLKKPGPTFLDLDYCSINGESFFVRGLIHLPIIGVAESFRWGVWGSLSRQNFETLLKMDDDPKRADLPPMFSWLSSQIADYPKTLNLKMYAHIQEPGTRPHFRLERGDHPLSLEYFHGVSPERVKEIMLRGLPAVDA
jgi:hypothetical protein